MTQRRRRYSGVTEIIDHPPPRPTPHPSISEDAENGRVSVKAQQLPRNSGFSPTDLSGIQLATFLLPGGEERKNVGSSPPPPPPPPPHPVSSDSALQLSFVWLLPPFFLSSPPSLSDLPINSGSSRVAEVMSCEISCGVFVCFRQHENERVTKGEQGDGFQQTDLNKSQGISFQS